MSVTSPPTSTRATLADLAKTRGKAELIAGRIVPLLPTGFRSSRIFARIYRSLDDHTPEDGQGVACTDNLGYAVPELTSGRESFSPDASFYLGPLPSDEMDFITGAPTLAIEVRTKGDFGDAAEAEIASKRAGYFEAGTAIVWDVDPKLKFVRAYRADVPDRLIVFSAGQVADAESAIPGWRFAVDLIFA